MSLICTLSGEPVQDPVVTKNGDVYEKRLIEKHIQTTGTDPITKQPLSLEDLTPVKAQPSPASTKPRITTQQSVPGLLASFQNEWDALMLETFNLKQQLQTTKQELSHALYQHDAACRVVARLIKERDLYKEELSNLRTQFASRPVGPESMDVDQGLPGLSTELKQKIAAKAKELSSARGARTISSTLTPLASIQQFKQASSHPIHKTSSPGILCVDFNTHPDKEHLILTGGMDKTAVLFNKNTGKKEATLSGHSKPVVGVKVHPENSNVLITASRDSTVRIWHNDTIAGKWSTGHILKLHSAEVTGLDLHPIDEIIITTSSDRSWALHDINKGVSLIKIVDPNIDLPYTCVRFHPDGLIMGTGGEDANVRIWDLRTQQCMAKWDEHKGTITDLAFSENGYYLSTAAEDKTIKLWDLRNPKTSLSSVLLDDVPHALNYDYSGKYLAAAVGTDIRVYTRTPGQKSDPGSATNYFDFIQTFDDHTKKVTGVKWGNDAKFIASTSMDRHLKIFA